MARGKARFLGNSGGRIRDWRFSGSVRKKIRDLYPGSVVKGTEDRRQIAREVCGEEIDEVPKNSADYWVDAIEDEAEWALSEVDAAAEEGCKQDRLAELTNLLNRSQLLRDDFRRLSPDVERLFPIEIDPFGYADILQTACESIEKAIIKAKELPRKEPIQATDHKIAVELAIRVLRVAKQYGMNISATADQDSGYYSNAVNLLSCVGEAVELYLGKPTWKTILIEARNKEQDLKST